MQSAQYTINNASSASEKSKATKAVTKYTKQLAEMKIYDEAIAHIANKRIEIDLDDGVKVNYEKFLGASVRPAPVTATARRIKVPSESSMTPCTVTAPGCTCQPWKGAPR